jgi:hypothetical protein
MVDFITSFNKGIDAAKTAEKNKKEIDSVFNSLNKQLKLESENTLFLKTETRYINNTFIDINLITTGKSRPTYSAIFASNPQIPDFEDKMLAIWKINRNGYPCVIHIGDNQLVCEDRPALESGLQELLSDPVVGDTLFKIINLEIPAGNVNTLENKDLGKDT